VFESIAGFDFCLFIWQQIDGISPTGRYTTLIPLVLVISVSALKEAIEDFV
jgi:phospholipid-transporting ATPase